MKFLIKTLGWERWRDEVLAEYERVQLEGGARLPFDPDAPPREEAPAWARDAAPSVQSIRDLVNRTRPRGPGLHPAVVENGVGAAAFDGWRGTNVRAQRQEGYSVVLVRLALGDVTAGQLRALAVLSLGVRRWRCAADAGSESVPAVGAGWRACAELFVRLAAAGLATQRSVDDSRCHELPGRRVVPAGRDAVARSWPGADRRAGSADPTSPQPRRRRRSRSAAAPTAADSITSRRSDFRAACARSTAAPCRSTS